MLKIDKINVHYGNSHENVLKEVSLRVDESEIVSIVGANGAGKTTLLNTVSGLIKPSAGSIEFDGKPSPANPVGAVRAGIIQVPEGRRVFAPLTVYENLVMGGYNTERTKARELMDEMFELFPILKDRRTQTAGTLSGGEQQMLAIARAMMAQPKLLLLDEPSLGIAPIIVKEIFSYLTKINESKKIPMLLVEQNAKVALGISHRAYVLEIGKITMEGSAKEISDDPHVIEAYFGGYTESKKGDKQ